MKVRAALALVLALLASAARADVTSYTFTGTASGAQMPGVTDGDVVTFQVSYDPSAIGTGIYMPAPIFNIYDSTSQVALPIPATGIGQIQGPSGFPPFIQSLDPGAHLDVEFYLYGANWPASGSDVFLDKLGYTSFDLRYVQLTSPWDQVSFDVLGGPFLQGAQAPEPASLTLLAAGALGMAWRLRRRRQSSAEEGSQ